ncbi:MAG: recombinase family protein [Planctomycetaceae bacterium]|nr:recombinase family protein [Planctomycetaceae bacterium]
MTTHPKPSDNSRQPGDSFSTEPVYARRKWAKRPPPADQRHLFADASSQRPAALETNGASDGGGPRAGSAAACREHPTAAAAGGPLFQYYGHCCDERQIEEFPVEEERIHSPEDVGQVVGQAYRVRACNCRKWFCEWCGPRLGYTLDSLAEQLRKEGIEYTAEQPDFTRSKLHTILRDRAYLGEVKYRESWHPGGHEPIVEADTFERVQLLFGGKTYKARDSVYGAGMVACGHCGRPVVVEIKRKLTSAGVREYRYYRCARYNVGDHPRVRVEERDFDNQVLGLLGRMRIEDEGTRRWIVSVLRAKGQAAEQSATTERESLVRELDGVRKQKERLLNLRLLDEIEAETFAAKQAELRSKETRLQTQLEGQGRQQSERADLAVKVFELSQTLAEKWVTADIPEKRLLLEIVCLNWTLNDVTLCPTMRKPFDILAEGLLVSSSRGNKTPIELFRPPISEIKGDVAGLIRDATPDFKRVSEIASTD